MAALCIEWGLIFGACSTIAAWEPGLGQPAIPAGGQGVELAGAVVDGTVVTRVRGTTSFPAARSTAEVKNPIITAARDPVASPESLTVRAETGEALADHLQNERQRGLHDQPPTTLHQQ